MSSLPRHISVHYTPEPHLTASRWTNVLAVASRYFSIGLVPLATAIWVINLYLLMAHT